MCGTDPPCVQGHVASGLGGGNLAGQLEPQGILTHPRSRGPRCLLSRGWDRRGVVKKWVGWEAHGFSATFTLYSLSDSVSSLDREEKETWTSPSPYTWS